MSQAINTKQFHVIPFFVAIIRGIIYWVVELSKHQDIVRLIPGDATAIWGRESKSASLCFFIQHDAGC